MLALESLASKYAQMQHNIAADFQKDAEKMKLHIRQTLCRCLPDCIVTDSLVADCYRFIPLVAPDHDPMHMGAIHAFAGCFLLHADCNDPMMLRLHKAACKVLSPKQAATRDDLRLVTLAALYEPKLLPDFECRRFVRYRLGLYDGIPRTCEEIACLLHQPLVYIHELEAAILFSFAHHAGGSHA